MVAFILPLRAVGLSTMSLLVLQVFVGAVVYLLFARLIKLETFTYLFKTLTGLKKSSKAMKL